MITELDKKDLSQALELVWNVFKEFEAPNYTEGGIKEFKKFISYETIITGINKKELQFWVYFDNNKIVGLIATREVDHICLLFVDKEYHKRGIARDLFFMVKNICENKKKTSITVNSSLYAVEFYHKIGFIDTDKLKCINGIKFIPMIFKL